MSHFLVHRQLLNMHSVENLGAVGDNDEDGDGRDEDNLPTANNDEDSQLPPDSNRSSRERENRSRRSNKAPTFGTDKTLATNFWAARRFGYREKLRHFIFGRAESIRLHHQTRDLLSSHAADNAAAAVQQSNLTTSQDQDTTTRNIRQRRGSRDRGRRRDRDGSRDSRRRSRGAVYLVFPHAISKDHVQTTLNAFSLTDDNADTLVLGHPHSGTPDTMVHALVTVDSVAIEHIVVSTLAYPVIISAYNLNKTNEHEHLPNLPLRSSCSLNCHESAVPTNELL